MFLREIIISYIKWVFFFKNQIFQCFKSNESLYIRCLIIIVSGKWAGENQFLKKV